MSTEEMVDEVAEQDVPIGGVVDGHAAGAAVAVIPQGITTVREVPCLGGTFGSVSVAYNGRPVRIGRDPRRRRLIVSVAPNAIVTAYVVISDNEQQALGGYGLPITQGTAPITLDYAGELWIMAFNAVITVGFVSMVDA